MRRRRERRGREEAAPASTSTDLVAQNVQAVAEIHSRAERRISRHQRAVELFTAALGQPATFYVILAVVAGWVFWNGCLASRLGRPVFDPPPFYWLQGVVGLSALVTTTAVLITENRQSKQAERRAQLDLHVNLLAEQKLAKAIALIEELRRDLVTAPDRPDPVAEAMKEAVDPHVVVNALDLTLDRNQGETPVRLAGGAAGSTQSADGEAVADEQG